MLDFRRIRSNSQKERKRLTMSYRGGDTAGDCKIYVGNLPDDIRKRDLEDLFFKYGNIVEVDLHDRKQPPFAFIQFEDPR